MLRNIKHKSIMTKTIILEVCCNYRLHIAPRKWRFWYLRFRSITIQSSNLMVLQNKYTNCYPSKKKSKYEYIISCIVYILLTPNLSIKLCRCICKVSLWERAAQWWIELACCLLGTLTSSHSPKYDCCIKCCF